MAKANEPKSLTFKDADGNTVSAYEGSALAEAYADNPSLTPVAPKTAKIHQRREEVEKVSDEEKRQLAAQAGVSNDPAELEKLSGAKAVDEIAKRGRAK